MEPNVQPNEPVNTPTEQPAAPQPPTFTPGISNDTPIQAPVQAPVEAPAENPAPQPTEAPQQTPVEPATPAQQPEQKPQSYEEYIESITGKSEPVETPKPSGVTDPAELDKFFEDYGASIRNQVIQEVQRANAVQTHERSEWEKVFNKYPEVKENPQIRETIHNMRMGAFNSGKAMTPVQAADFLVGALHNEYKKGVNDTNVQTTIQESQPLNGGGAPAADPGVDYGSLQDGGRDAAVTQLEALIRAGKI